MKFPNFLVKTSFSARALVILAGLFLMAVTVPAQSAPTINTDIEQCRNGAAGSPVQCIDGAWQNGNAGSSNSHYAENQFAPYRGVITGLTVGTVYHFTLGYDILQNGKHAVDYLGSYNYTYTDADPCHDAGCTLASPTSTIAFPTDTVTVTNNINPYTNSPIVQIPGVLTMWGGQLTAIAYEAYSPGAEHRSIDVTFTATSTTAVIAFGGHIAWGGDWGAGNSAGGIQGSPYHTEYDACDFPCQTHNNSLSAAAVVISGIINIVKVANPLDGTGKTAIAFPFTASAGFNPLSFNIVDNVAGSGGVTVQSLAITSFGAANAITVTENAKAGWSLAGISCSSNAFASSTNTFPGGTSATITTNEGGQTTCTFTNTQLTVTAAPGSVSGRALTSMGSPISGVSIRLADLSTGEVMTATTNTFGYYSFDGLKVQDFYQVTATSKRYRFSSSKTFNLSGDLTDLDFIANAQ